MWQPGGFHKPLAARHRQWRTATGKANFITPKTLSGNIDIDPERRDIFQLSIFRSQGQFNTTIYSYRDRFRGVSGTRMVLFMNRNDRAASAAIIPSATRWCRYGITPKAATCRPTRACRCGSSMARRRRPT